MKLKTNTLLEKFEAAKLLSAEAGFKIFTPSPKHYRSTHQFIAASNNPGHVGIFRIWIRYSYLAIEFLPFYENRPHQTFLELMLKTKIIKRKKLPAMKRFDPIHNMVIASEHTEFDSLIPTVRLP